MKLYSNIITSRELSQPKYHTIMKILLMSVTQRGMLCKEKGIGNIFTFLTPKKRIIIQENRTGGDAVKQQLGNCSLNVLPVVNKLMSFHHRNSHTNYGKQA